MSEGFFDEAKCRECGGVCCSRYPGAVWPCDCPEGEDLAAWVTELLATKRYAVDWWEGPLPDGPQDMSQVYFIRPSVQGEEGKVRDPTWGGPCTFLGEGRPPGSDEGCRLLRPHRPYGCRMLEPMEGNDECVSHDGGKEGACRAWLPYQKEIEDAVSHGEVTPCPR